jgi:hypothetical protein
VALASSNRLTPAHSSSVCTSARLSCSTSSSRWSKIRLWPLVNRGNFPSWFRDFVDLEAGATRIQAFEAQLVPGLLQTEAYAQAVLRAGRHPDVAERVAARLDRQRILSRSTPPLLWAVIDEGVLRRCIGSPTVMQEQLKRLVEVATSPHIVLQILPYSSGAHAGLGGSMTTLSFDESPDVAYVAGIGSGQLILSPEGVERCRLVYDLVRAAALSPEASADMILETIESTT